MRLVIDTNIVVSGLLWDGVPGRLIDAAENLQIELIASPALIAELSKIIVRPKFARQLGKRGTSGALLIETYARLVTLVDPSDVPRVVVRDADDDHVIAAAIEGRADLIVSGDTDLLDLQSHAGIPIVRPVEALTLIAD